MRKLRLAHANGDVMGKAESMAIHTDRKGKSNLRYKTQLLSRFCGFVLYYIGSENVVFCFSFCFILVFIQIKSVYIIIKSLLIL